MKKFILAVDVGNTSAFFALYRGQKLVRTYRIKTSAVISQGINLLRKQFSWSQIEAVVVASVVPSVSQHLKKKLPAVFKVKTYILGKDIKVPIANHYDRPKQVGMDRLINALAVSSLYKKDTIVIDFGTAITFDVVSQKQGYLGGVIAPGIEIALDALFERTALLPKINLKHPKQLIAKNTVESIRTGCTVGIGGLCDRMVESLAKEWGRKPLVIATGGYAQFMRRYCRSIDKIDDALIMKGILLAYRLASKSHKKT